MLLFEATRCSGDAYKFRIWCWRRNRLLYLVSPVKRGVWTVGLGDCPGALIHRYIARAADVISAPADGEGNIFVCACRGISMTSEINRLHCLLGSKAAFKIL